MIPKTEQKKTFSTTSFRKTSLYTGSSIVVFLLITVIVSSFFTPYSPIKMNIPRRFGPPTQSHWFGTDQYGRDIFSRVLAGSKITLFVGTIAVGVGLIVGLLIGTLASLEYRWLNEMLMRFMDILYAFPPLLTALLLTSIYGPSITNTIISIGIFNIPIFARLARANFITLKEKQFVEAAEALGRNKAEIIVNHLLPNSVSPLVVQSSIQFAVAILAEAGLSYLGLGVQPPHASWGLMLKQAQTFMTISPWLAMFPGLAIVISVLGFNMLGDGLRDALDPRLTRP